MNERFDRTHKRLHPEVLIRMYPEFVRTSRRFLVLIASFVLSGCAGTVEMARDLIGTLADIDVVSVADVFGWQTAVELAPEQTARLASLPGARPLWQNVIDESAATAFSPVFDNGAVYGAGVNGRLVRFDAGSGKETASIDTERRLSGGVGAGEGMLLVGTFKGEILAYDEQSGKALWTAQVSSEVLSPPRADGGVVVVRTGDGRIFGLEAATGKRKWIYQGATPSLTVRSYAGVLISQGVVFAGFAGGKLIALNLNTGAVNWEAVVSRPRGATELERITDVTSLPIIDGQHVCAVAYQGRVACFDVAGGNPIWARDVSSNAGLTVDDHYIYVSEDRGAVSAYDKNDGTSVWRQELLIGLKLSPPLVRGDQVVVADSQGFVNVIRKNDGSVLGRAATDQTAIATRPVPLPNGIAVQTRKGGLYAFSTDVSALSLMPGQSGSSTGSPMANYFCGFVPFCK
jgi:outer membrane protein assembly factor BamB